MHVRVLPALEDVDQVRIMAYDYSVSHVGPIAPIAVPVRAALDLTTPTWRELRAVLITVAGLAMFMWGVNPVPSTTRPSPSATSTA